MEGFTYTDIFATKGLEYLIITGFFLILIPFWMLITKKTAAAEGVTTQLKSLTTGSVNLPQGIFFSRYHTWAHLEKHGEAKIGLNDLLLHITGEVYISHYKEKGETIQKGEPLARVQYNGRSLEVLSPVSGEILEVNAMLAKNPSALKNDPYQKGWIYEIRPTNWKKDTDSCFLAEDANNWATGELLRFKEFLSVASVRTSKGIPGVVMQDGGEIAEKALTLFPEEVWKEFQENFLL